RLSIASLILNIWVGALMALLGLIALAALLFSQLSAILATPLFKLAEGLNWLMVHSVDPFANAGIASVRLPQYTGWPSIIYILYYVPLALLAIVLARWNPFTPIADFGLRNADWKDRPFRFLQSAIRNPHSAIARPRYAAVALVAMFALIVFHPLSAGRPGGRLRVDFLDV